eukprot:3369205-Pyramimonas_sp.AAC.1
MAARRAAGLRAGTGRIQVTPCAKMMRWIKALWLKLLADGGPCRLPYTLWRPERAIAATPEATIGMAIATRKNCKTTYVPPAR